MDHGYATPRAGEGRAGRMRGDESGNRTTSAGSDTPALRFRTWYANTSSGSEEIHNLSLHKAFPRIKHPR